MVAFLFVILVFTLIALFLNRWLRQYINPCDYPNNIWYRHHLERNFEYLVLGNGIDRWNYTNLSLGGGKYFNLALRNQSLERDYFVLRQNFSILGPSGIAIIPLDCLDYYFNSDVKDKRPYVYCNFGYTLSVKRYAQVFKKICKYYPILMIRPKDVYALARHCFEEDEQYFTDISIIRKSCFKSRDDANFPRIIDEILAFCVLRDIVPLFIISPMSSIIRNEITDKAVFNMEYVLRNKGCFFLDLYSNFFDDSMFEQDGLRLTIQGKEILTSKIEMARRYITNSLRYHLDYSSVDEVLIHGLSN